ncbi:MAG: hypothetical protein M1827_004402 [Pycnora praestabilis]|nr:MAG: hypothetical protein M1827_004402 [Pycnora praestabilis]
MRSDAQSDSGSGGTLRDSSTINPSGSKKRRASPSGSGAGSRGVANLTPEQLAKKRANDREAQRAIRERTKNQIEALEKRIQDLTSQKPYQDLQHVLRQKQVVQAENDEIRKRLQSVLAIIQPIVGTQGLNDLANTASLVQAPPPTGPQSRHHEILQNRTVQNPQANFQVPPSTLSNSTSTIATTPSPVRDSSDQRHWQLPGARSTSEARAWSPVNAFDQQRDNLAHGLDMTSSGERLGFDFLLDGRQHIAKVSNGCTSASPLSSNHPQMEIDMQNATSGQSSSATSASRMDGYLIGQSSTPVMAFAAPVQNIAPTCPLDSLLLDFLAERQRRAAEGVSSKKLVGPAYPSVSSLLNPERSIYSHPLSKVFTDILERFPDLSSLPQQIAVLYVMFLVMRWQIAPTHENYERLPDWMTPRPSQLFTPHPAWIDHLPWPRMRDEMVQNYQDYPFENFFIPYTTTLSLNWPYEPTDTLLSTGDSEELMINPVFERHLRNLNNWSLGPAFAQAHPLLAERVRIKVEDEKLSKQ